MLGNGQCFSHGQLYVAFSRVRKECDIKVMIGKKRMARNVVMQQILDKEEIKEAEKIYVECEAEKDDILPNPSPSVDTPNYMPSTSSIANVTSTFSTPTTSRKNLILSTPQSSSIVCTPTSVNLQNPTYTSQSSANSMRSTTSNSSFNPTPSGKSVKSCWNDFKPGQERKRGNLMRKNVEKDGNCFYHASAYSMMVIFLFFMKF